MKSQIIHGDALEILKNLPHESVQCCITSPPYWGLRDYGVDGQLGLEKTPEFYVEKMVEVFREVKRVLRNDGTLWLNLGDSYTHGVPGGGYVFEKGRNRGDRKSYESDKARGREKISTLAEGLKIKDLIGLPWMVAFSLRADGWWLRSCIPWIKRNAMPESVVDRPSTAVEYIFLLAKTQKYFYDAEAVKMQGAGNKWGKYSNPKYGNGSEGRMQSVKELTKDEYVDKYQTRNRRNSDWFFESWRGLLTNEEGDPLAMVVNPVGYSEAHFATFPEMMIEPLIKAGTSEKGCCPECGKPWVRVTDISYLQHRKAGKWCDRGQEERGLNRSESQYKYGSATRIATTTGFSPTCTHNHEPAPCIVLDPFSGAGTTGLVAEKLGRDYIGIELNPEYVRMSNRRINAVKLPLFEELEN